MGQSIFQAAGIGVPQAPSQPAQQPQISGGAPMMTPVQRAAFVMQAMTNPAAFVKQQFPDIPNEIINNPQEIFNYLQRTRGISQADIQKAQAENPFGGGR